MVNSGIFHEKKQGWNLWGAHITDNVLIHKLGGGLVGIHLMHCYLYCIIMYIIFTYINVYNHLYIFFQFSSVTQSCPILCDPMDCSTPGFPVYHQLLELAQTQVHWVSDTIQPSHPLSSPSPPTFNLSQHQGLFKWISSSQQVVEVLALQLQHQSFQWIFRTDFL